MSLVLLVTIPIPPMITDNNTTPNNNLKCLMYHIKIIIFVYLINYAGNKRAND